MGRRSAERADALLQSGAATKRARSRRRTLGVCVCCECNRWIGIRVWPWSGQLLLKTHGYCGRCSARLLAAMPVDEVPVREP